MDSNVTTSLNLNKICRACLSEQEEDQMKSLFCEIEECGCNEEESSFLYEIIMNVSSIRVFEDDRMPSAICMNCYNQAVTAYKFRLQCDRSNLILQGCLEQAKLVGTIISEEMSNLVDLGTEENPQTVYLVTSVSPELIDTAEILNDDSISVIDTTVTKQEEQEFIEDVKDESVTEDIKQEEESVELNASVVAYSVENRIMKQRLALKKINNVLNSKINQKTKQEVLRNNYFASMAKVSDEGERVFECTVCKKEYKHSSSLKVHFRNHTSERPYICNVCNKGFKQWTSLQHHSRTHTGEQPFACKLCDKRYRQAASLTAHMRVHTGQRPFLCSICGKGFRQSPDLYYHMRTHTKEKPYMCTVCGKCMAMQSHLVQHMRTHTGERPFECKVCSKAFASTTRLKRHEIIHTGLKPYKCDVCDKSFNRSSTLRVHSMIHSEIRPHICHICEKGFIQAHCLRNHLNTHK